MINYFENLGENSAMAGARILYKLKIKPLPVTVFRFLVAAPVSIYFFSRGQYLYNVIGLLLYMTLAILDWVDGALAQLYKLPASTKPFGSLIDHTLDRILMLIVLGSLLYANKNFLLTIIFYSVYFFQTVLQYEFDKIFHLDFARYPEIEKIMRTSKHRPGTIDLLLYNLLYVHNNSLTKFCFTISYALFIGIIINQLPVAFIFIIFMSSIRSIGILLIMFKTLKSKKTYSVLANSLRNHQPS